MNASPPCSLSQVGVEEVGHDVVCFFGFGECGVVPECVGQSFEDYELDVDSRTEVGAMEDGGAAEENIAPAGDEEGGWESFEICIQG